MKRFSSSDSLGALVSICPPKEKKNPKKSDAYSREFQAMLDGFEEEDSAEETGKTTEKKRRLSFDQVKALEKCFEAVNKLEPDRKLKIAQELGLQPRQVAVWFQNRRARWKTKQLEKDYVILKASYDSLKLNFDTLEREKEALIAELKELKLKLQDENTESNHSVKKEALFSESDNIVSVQSPFPVSNESESANPSHDFRTNSDGLEFKGFADFKDGTSDSGSSGILKEDSNLNAQLQKSPASSSLRFDYSSSLSSSSSMNGFHLSNSIAIPAKACQHQFVRIEEQNLFSTDESCNFFSVDQAPTLHWYFHDQ